MSSLVPRFPPQPSSSARWRRFRRPSSERPQSWVAAGDEELGLPERPPSSPPAERAAEPSPAQAGSADKPDLQEQPLTQLRELWWLQPEVERIRG